MPYLTRAFTLRTTKAPQWGWTSPGKTKNTGAPTEWLITLKGETAERRVMIYSNGKTGSFFVTIKGTNHYLMPKKLRKAVNGH